MKKFLSFLLTFVMLFSLAMPAMAAEPTVTGNTESDVKATFDPEIAITDLSFEAENIYYDQATNTYTIPLFEDPNGSIDYTEVYSGKNLKYYADAENVLIKGTLTTDGTSQTVQVNLAEYVAAGGELFTYDADTGMLKGEMAAPGEFKAEYQYSNDNGTNWSDPVTIEAKRVYDISVRDDIENGRVIADKAFAGAGETVTLTVTPDEGYELELVGYFNADDLTADPVFIENNQFVMPEYDILLYATFVEATKTYTVTLREPFENGAVTIEGDKTSFTEGETVTLKVTPDEGYELDTLTVNGVDVAANVAEGKYSFPMGDADVEVAATFKKITYAIEIGTFEGGSVSADVETAAEGDTVTLTVTTTGKYQLKSIIVMDAEDRTVAFTESGVVSGIYKFIMPASDVTVEAVFEEVLTTSADIAWGSLSFVYTDGENGAEDGAWSCEEDANKITVKNIGDNAFSATPAYEAKDGFNEISGAFFDNNGEEVDAIAGARLDSGETCDFYLCLDGTPAKALDGVIGEVTVKINSAPAAESAVMYVSTEYTPHYEDPSYYTGYRYVITFYNEAGTELSDSQVYTEQNVPVPIPDGAASISITLEAFDSTSETWGLARESNKTDLPGVSCNVKYSCGWSGDNRVDSVTITPIN